MLFGRDAERAHLEQVLDAVECGPAGCIVEGTPGVGKTTLWRESVESARRRGYQVLETAPSEPDSALAFSGLSDLFEQLPDEVLGTLPEAQADALKAALSIGELPEGSRGLQALPRGVLGVLRHLCLGGPVVVAIDDEQWLDPASARALAFALCRLHEETIAVLVARRPEPTSPLSTELGRRFGAGGLETVWLAPLPVGVIKELVEDRLKRTIPRPVLGRIHHAAGGNPLYSLAIALELEARHMNGDRAGDLPVPRTLSDAIELRLEHVDPRASSALLAIAALSQPTLALLQAAIPEFALSDLDSAERVGVIEISGDRVRFTHPLLASTHYRNTPSPKRRELHRRLASVIEDEEECAQHAALGAEAPDSGLADTLERAAGVAARRGANESAAQLLEDAARLTPLDQESARHTRIVAAAEHRFNSGEVTRARGLLDEVMPHLSAGAVRARARIQLSLIRSDEPRVATELLQAAAADARGNDRLQVQIDTEITSTAAEVGWHAMARAHSESALSAAERLGDAGLVAMAVGHLLVTFVCNGEPLNRDLLERLSTMEASAAVPTYHHPSTNTGLALYWTDDMDAARPLLEAAARRALSRGEEWDRLGILLALADLEWESGNRQLAEQHLYAANEAFAGEYSEALLWLVGLEVRFALDTGDLTAARAKAEHGLVLAEEKSTYQHKSRLSRLLAAVELLSGRPELAHDRLQELRHTLASNGFGRAGSPKIFVWSQDVEALIAMGRLDEAQDVLVELRGRAEVCQSPYVDALASRCEGLLLAARGELIAAIEAMDAALAMHAKCRRPYEHGRTLLEKGSIERRAKHKAAAKQTLEEALAILEPLGAEFWVSRTRDELSRIGLRRSRAAEGLTAAQARVADLVAAGLTNPQIAQQLHMSLRTVESHLSRVYREYGVSSRSQLTAMMTTAGDRALATSTVGTANGGHNA
jgi:DNA-binding CsgD family transcriptional regulator